MATTTITVTSGAWVQISNGEDKTSINHVGGSTVFIHQAATMPIALDAPVMKVLRQNEEFIAFGLGSDTEYIFALATANDAILTTTPAIEA
jgi:hypothetical protein